MPEHDKYVEQLSIHTDLAVEAHEASLGSGGDTRGIKVETFEFEGGKVSKVIVQNGLGSARIGKPPGTYITIEAEGLRHHDVELRDRVSQVLADELRALFPDETEGASLVVGLGNWHVTPDSLGPKVIEELLVTRHLFEYAPDYVDDGMRSVCAIAPGVLGITGIETGDIIRGIVERVKPARVIAVDALAARSMDRLGTTIQIADTGISPGSGVGNKRQSLSLDTLGVPVLAIGVPTVVYANTIVIDAMSKLTSAVQEAAGDKPALEGMIGGMSEVDRGKLVHEVLSPFWGDLVVSPKEVDEQIRQMSKVIAGGLNVCLQPGLKTSDTLRYLQ